MSVDRETIIKWAREANVITNSPYVVPYDNMQCALERFAKLAAEHEREACAKYLDDQNTAMTDILAAEIRARGGA